MYPLYSVQVTFCTDDDDDDRMIGGRADEKDISWEVVCKTGVALLPIFHTRLPPKVWHPMTRGAKISRGAISRFEQKKCARLKRGETRRRYWVAANFWHQSEFVDSSAAHQIWGSLPDRIPQSLICESFELSIKMLTIQVWHSYNIELICSVAEWRLNW